jgi:hypothetical protein
MDGSTKPDKISFEYKISPNFAVYAVSGVYGGLNAQGQVIINFLSERSAIPKTQTYSIQADNTLSEKPIREEKKEEVIRDVMFAISISPPTARSFAKWLNEKADEFEEILKIQREKADV